MLWYDSPSVLKGLGWIPDCFRNVVGRIPIGFETCLIGFPIRFWMTLHGFPIGFESLFVGVSIDSEMFLHWFSIGFGKIVWVFFFRHVSFLSFGFPWYSNAYVWTGRMSKVHTPQPRRHPRPKELTCICPVVVFHLSRCLQPGPPLDHPAFCTGPLFSLCF